MPRETNSAPSPWALGRDRAAERKEKLEAVLRTAAKAFSEFGYHRTSLDGIAERLSITKPTLYYYAAGKEDLIASVVKRALGDILEFGPPDPHASGLNQLRVLLRRYIEVVATDFGRCLVLLNDFELGEATAGRIREGKRAIDRSMRGMIDKGKKDGSIAPCDTRLTAFMLAGAVNGVGRWYRADQAMSPQAVSEIFVNQMTAGLQPR